MTGPSDSGVQVEALKNCPFCGGGDFDTTEFNGLLDSVGCKGCGAVMLRTDSRGDPAPRWNRRAVLPVAPSDADRELMEQEIDALEELTETLEMGDPHWADAKCFKAAVAAIAALRTRLLRHSEGKAG